VSVRTGIAPQSLLELDGPMFDALVTELEQDWPPALELAAQELETTHALLRMYLAAHLRKGATLPPPLVVDRPKRDDEPELEERPARPRAPRVDAAGFALLTGQAITVAPGTRGGEQG
jgi:hypothetical protein